jgi:hypothetical protein
MVQVIDIDKIQGNRENPRVIKDSKFQKLVNSIQEFPEMLYLRPIVVNKDMVILGGNMRHKAAKDAGLKEIPIIIAENLDEAKEREFIIKDNVGFGEWDWDALANLWDIEELDEWGLELPVTMSTDQLGEEFNLPDGDKEPFQQMTFTLADQQAEVIKNAIDIIRGTEEFKYVETYANENGNGNALYLIITQWVEQRK